MNDIEKSYFMTWEKKRKCRLKLEQLLKKV